MKKLFYHIFIFFLILLLVQSCSDDILGTDSAGNTPPVAEIESEQEVAIGEKVVLDGSESHDPDEDELSYSWEIITKPQESEATLHNPDSVKASFTPDARGSYQIQLTVSDGKDSHSATLSATADIKVLENITEDMTLTNIFDDPQKADYAVSGISDVRADLTIEPGVHIEFGSDTRMDIESEGSLIAIGTEEAPIRFTGAVKSPGSWRGIHFKSLSPDNELSHVIVEYGGDNNANIFVNNNGAVTINHTTSQFSSSYGLEADNGAQLRDFSNNVFADNETAIMNIPTNLIGSLDINSDYNGESGTDYISTLGGGEVNTNQTWPSIEVPYIIDGFVDIKSEVKVQPGAMIKFKQEARLDIEEGALTAIGTSDNPIKFLGNEETSGFWQGIRFRTKNTANELTYTEVSHGGANGKANVVVDNSGAVKITNSTLTSSETYGLEVDKRGGDLIEFSNNTISSDAITRIPDYLMGEIDTDSDFGTDSYISVVGTQVKTDQTWVAAGVPYRIEDIIDIQADVTINPGASLEFISGARIDIESGTNGGSLNAVGTQADSIKFIGTNNVQGHWDGIRFRTKSDSNLLEYCVISDGGRGGDARNGNIDIWSNGGVTVKHSSIRNSAANGVVYSHDGEFTGSDNTYSNITLEEVYYNEL